MATPDIRWIRPTITNISDEITPKLNISWKDPVGLPTGNDISGYYVTYYEYTNNYCYNYLIFNNQSNTGISCSIPGKDASNGIVFRWAQCNNQNEAISILQGSDAVIEFNDNISNNKCESIACQSNGGARKNSILFNAACYSSADCSAVSCNNATDVSECINPFTNDLKEFPQDRSPGWAYDWSMNIVAKFDINALSNEDIPYDGGAFPQSLRTCPYDFPRPGSIIGPEWPDPFETSFNGTNFVVAGTADSFRNQFLAFDNSRCYQLGYENLPNLGLSFEYPTDFLTDYGLFSDQTLCFKIKDGKNNALGDITPAWADSSTPYLPIVPPVGYFIDPWDYGPPFFTISGDLEILVSNEELSAWGDECQFQSSFNGTCPPENTLPLSDLSCAPIPESLRFAKKPPGPWGCINLGKFGAKLKQQANNGEFDGNIVVYPELNGNFFNLPEDSKGLKYLTYGFFHGSGTVPFSKSDFPLEGTLDQSCCTIDLKPCWDRNKPFCISGNGCPRPIWNPLDPLINPCVPWTEEANTQNLDISYCPGQQYLPCSLKNCLYEECPNGTQIEKSPYFHFIPPDPIFLFDGNDPEVFADEKNTLINSQGRFDASFAIAQWDICNGEKANIKFSYYLLGVCLFNSNFSNTLSPLGEFCIEKNSSGNTYSIDISSNIDFGKLYIIIVKIIYKPRTNLLLSNGITIPSQFSGPNGCGYGCPIQRKNEFQNIANCQGQFLFNCKWIRPGRLIIRQPIAGQVLPNAYISTLGSSLSRKRKQSNYIQNATAAGRNTVKFVNRSTQCGSLFNCGLRPLCKLSTGNSNPNFNPGRNRIL